MSSDPKKRRLTDVLLVFAAMVIGLATLRVSYIELNQGRTQLYAISEDIKSLRAQVRTLSQSPESAQVSAQLSQLNSSLTELESQQTRLEKIISESPGEEVFVLACSIERVYDFNKWLLGAMSVSVIPLVVSHHLK